MILKRIWTTRSDFEKKNFCQHLNELVEKNFAKLAFSIDGKSVSYISVEKNVLSVAYWYLMLIIKQIYVKNLIVPDFLSPFSISLTSMHFILKSMTK